MPELPQTHGDARCFNGFDENHPDLARDMTVTKGKRASDERWKPLTLPIGRVAALCCVHQKGRKDGDALVFGDLVPGPRAMTAVKSISAVGLDVDDGTSPDVIDKALAAQPYWAFRYSTHSNGAVETFVTNKAFDRWSRDHADAAPANDELIGRYFAESRGVLAPIAEAATIVGVDHRTAGPGLVVAHPPIFKNRVVVPLLNPFVLIDEGGGDHGTGCAMWPRIPLALGAALGLNIDKSCLDPHRLFYLPRHPAGGDYSASVFGGRLLDFKELETDNPWTAEAARIQKTGRQSNTDHGLGRWAARRAHGFQVVTAIEAFAPEKVRSETAIGVEIECAWDCGHSNSGDPDDRACLAINAGSGSSDRFAITCRHASCAGRSNLDHLGKMIADGWFGREVLDDERFNAIVSDDEQLSATGMTNEIFDFTDERDLVEALNKKIAMVHVGGDVRFIRHDDRDLSLYSRQAMETYMSRWNYHYTENDKPKRMPAFKKWIESPDLTEFLGIEFQPDLSNAHPRRLNLFRGFGTVPAHASASGSYALFADHIEKQIAGGDPEKADYFWAWAADIIQNPARKLGVAMILRGAKGCGKSTVGEVLSCVIGEYLCPVIDSGEGLTGRFGAHLERALLLNVEEAYHANDPRHESRLKSLITSPRVPVEGKYRDTKDAPSYCRILMTTNSDHVVPASNVGGAMERRYAVFDVASTRVQDSAYFGAMRAELEAGGYEALMRDLMARDLSSTDLRRVPRTDGLSDQIRLSLKPDEAWWAGILETGSVPFVRGPNDSTDADFDWPANAPLTIGRNDLYTSYVQFCPGYRGPPSPAALGKFLASACPSVRSVKATVKGDRVNSYILPPRAEARSSFLTSQPGLALGDQEAEAVTDRSEPPNGRVITGDFSGSRRLKAA